MKKPTICKERFCGLKIIDGEIFCPEHKLYNQIFDKSPTPIAFQKPPPKRGKR